MAGGFPASSRISRRNNHQVGVKSDYALTAYAPSAIWKTHYRQPNASHCHKSANIYASWQSAWVVCTHSESSRPALTRQPSTGPSPNAGLDDSHRMIWATLSTAQPMRCNSGAWMTALNVGRLGVFWARHVPKFPIDLVWGMPRKAP